MRPARVRLAPLASAVAVVMATVTGAGGAARAASAPIAGLHTLSPGARPDVTETVPVNVVLVGLQPGTGPQQIDAGRLAGALPAQGSPAVRIPGFYGLHQPLGETWRYDYHLTWASQQFQDTLWAELSSLARPAPLTAYQSIYNDQRSRSLDVTDNEVIDARAVESWLAANAPALLGVDTTEDTVFYIDWFGQPGFRFHVYDAAQPDPDTGFNFADRDKNKIVAFGGTPPPGPAAPTRRVWFDDVSAGPDRSTFGYDLDDIDIPGWTPGASGSRPRSRTWSGLARCRTATCRPPAWTSP